MILLGAENDGALIHWYGVEILRTGVDGLGIMGGEIIRD